MSGCRPNDSASSELKGTSTASSCSLLHFDLNSSESSAPITTTGAAAATTAAATTTTAAATATAEENVSNAILQQKRKEIVLLQCTAEGCMKTFRKKACLERHQLSHSEEVILCLNSFDGLFYYVYFIV